MLYENKASTNQWGNPCEFYHDYWKSVYIWASVAEELSILLTNWHWATFKHKFIWLNVYKIPGNYDTRNNEH